MTALAGLLGAGAGFGMVLVLTGLTGVQPLPRWRPSTPSRAARWNRSRVTHLLLLAAVGIATGIATGWVVGGLLAALAAATLPRLVGPDHAHRAAIQRAEAIATWTEQLRDTLAGAAGIEQAITATAPLAPTPIRPRVTALATRLDHQPLPAALHQFAQDLADPTGDLIVAALLHAAQRPAGRLGDQLGALAQLARDGVAVRLRVAVARARVRSSLRIITATVLVTALGLVVGSRDLMAHYDPPVGQLVLAAIGGMFAVSFAWLGRLSRLPSPRRILAVPHPSSTSTVELPG